MKKKDISQGILPMITVTFCFAVLLASGLAASKVCQRFHLPSVTGYIIAGLILGPTGFNLVTSDTTGDDLSHFTQIALMLIAFGIGEHIEFRTIRQFTRSLKWISICEALAAFTVVSLFIYSAIQLTGFTIAGWVPRDYIILSLLLGSIGVATAPAATLMVIREIKARGPVTSTLMAIVAIDDGLAIIIFGLVVSIAHQVLGQADTTILASFIASLVEILGSMVLGILSGTVLLLILNRMRDGGELVTAGLAVLLLCGEIALMLHLSPLLAGMSAGCLLVNKAERDVRVFRALNRFEPPIYVIFFTLAGTHLDFDSLRTAGILGITYFLATVTGKITGVYIGGVISDAPETVRRYLGLTMFPQAGVAIGLIFLLSSDQLLLPYSAIITPIVLTGVFISEMIGPVTSRFALTRAGEARIDRVSPGAHEKAAIGEVDGKICALGQTIRIPIWGIQGEFKLIPPEKHKGFILFHSTEQATGRALARIATLFAHQHDALPMSIRVSPEDEPIHDELLITEEKEVESMGYPLTSELVPSPDRAAGIIAGVQYNPTHSLLLAYPLDTTPQPMQDEFHELLDFIVPKVDCPLAVVRFYGELKVTRTLIPLVDLDELDLLHHFIKSLAGTGKKRWPEANRLHLLYMLPPDVEDKEILTMEECILSWLNEQSPPINAMVQAVPTDSRIEVIAKAAEDADLVVMSAKERSGLRRMFLGSLVDSVAARVQKTLIVVHNGGTTNVNRNPLTQSTQEDQK
ncbi:cation:proton antiporter [Desulfosediminicola sp.]|uniref:cation:proton antiporter domain-containing protein n=1 Tax=Desulfosediminicola sp. TaxID=2886825 RepID=UPI003AF2445C